jgi:hypothetical protein
LLWLYFWRNKSVPPLFPPSRRRTLGERNVDGSNGGSDSSTTNPMRAHSDGLPPASPSPLTTAMPHNIGPLPASMTPGPAVHHHQPAGPAPSSAVEDPALLRRLARNWMRVEEDGVVWYAKTTGELAWAVSMRLHSTGRLSHFSHNRPRPNRSRPTRTHRAGCELSTMTARLGTHA